jgi:hypothetical protein
VAVNLRGVVLSEIAGLAWLVAVLVVALIARRDRPFASAEKVHQAWVLLGVAELVGMAFGLVSAWLASSSLGPAMPALFVPVQIVFLLVLQTAFFAWVSTFPVLRLLAREFKRWISGSGGRLG